MGEGGALDVRRRWRCSPCRSAHAVHGRLDDGRVGRLDGGGELCGIGRLGAGLGDGLDGDRAGNLTGGVAAHAVAHAEQRRGGEIGVLVVAAHAAHVGAGAPHEHGGRAGIEGGVGVDQVVGDGLEVHGRAGIVELGLHGLEVDLGRVFRRDGCGRIGDRLDGNLGLGLEGAGGGVRRSGRGRGGGFGRDGGRCMRRGRMGGRHGGRLVVIGRPGIRGARCRNSRGRGHRGRRSSVLGL